MPTISKMWFNGSSSSLYIFVIHPTDSEEGSGKFRIFSRFPLVVLDELFVKGQGRLVSTCSIISQFSSSSSNGLFFPMDTALGDCIPDKLLFSLKAFGSWLRKMILIYIDLYN